MIPLLKGQELEWLNPQIEDVKMPEMPKKMNIMKSPKKLIINSTSLENPKSICGNVHSLVAIGVCRSRKKRTFSLVCYCDFS